LEVWDSGTAVLESLLFPELQPVQAASIKEAAIRSHRRLELFTAKASRHQAEIGQENKDKPQNAEC
jgi:hypothetical protein